MTKLCVMKTTVLAALLCASALVQAAPMRGVTEKGDEIVLHDDGTWKYIKPMPDAPAAVPLNDRTFRSAITSNFEVKSTKTRVSVYVNPKKWSFTKVTRSDYDHEFSFRSSQSGLYGLLITEQLAMPIESVSNAALSNLRKQDPGAELVHQEYRSVNGRKLMHLRMNATVNGLKISYFGYYFSDDSGSTQFIAFTSQSLAPARMGEIEEFLNGLQVQP